MSALLIHQRMEEPGRPQRRAAASAASRHSDLWPVASVRWTRREDTASLCFHRANTTSGSRRAISAARRHPARSRSNAGQSAEIDFTVEPEAAGMMGMSSIAKRQMTNIRRRSGSTMKPEEGDVQCHAQRCYMTLAVAAALAGCRHETEQPAGEARFWPPVMHEARVHVYDIDGRPVGGRETVWRLRRARDTNCFAGRRQGQDRCGRLRSR